MFDGAMEWACKEINQCFQLSSTIDGYVLGLGGAPLNFAAKVWDVSMILAAVVFAIVACYEIYSLTVRTEAHGGPMGSAEIVFKVMFKVAVCFIVLQVSFEILRNLYMTTNSLTAAIGNIPYGTSLGADVIDTEAIMDQMPDGLTGIIPVLLALVVLLFAWAAKLAAAVLIMLRLIQIYIYIAIAPIPLATFPSHEYSQVAKSFLKSFIAVCIQGTLIYLVVRFLPTMIDTIIQSDLVYKGDSLIISLGIALLYSVAVLSTLLGTQQLSRRLCGAM